MKHFLLLLFFLEYSKIHSYLFISKKQLLGELIKRSDKKNILTKEALKTKITLQNIEQIIDEKKEIDATINFINILIKMEDIWKNDPKDPKESLFCQFHELFLSFYKKIYENTKEAKTILLETELHITKILTHCITEGTSKEWIALYHFYALCDDDIMKESMFSAKTSERKLTTIEEDMVISKIFIIRFERAINILLNKTVRENKDTKKDFMDKFIKIRQEKKEKISENIEDDK